MSVKQTLLSVLMAALCGPGVVRAQLFPPGPAGADAPPAPKAAPGLAEGMPVYANPALSNADAAPAFSSTPGPALPPVASSPAAAPAGTTPDGVAIEEGSPPAPPPVPVPLGLPASPWLTYPRSPCCCGSVGSCGGPIGADLFIRSGFSFPVGPGIFEKYLHTGWDVEGGAQLFFFNPPSTRAWTVMLSISNIFNRTGNENQPITLYRVPVRTTVEVPGQTNIPGSVRATTPAIVQVPVLTATVSSLNQTFVNLGFGRDWWLLGSANPGQMCRCNWRVGVDAGGRWGSAMVQFNEINHRTDVVGGMFCGIHSYVEWPCRCAIPFAGARYEYNYIWTSLLQDQNNGDYQSMNLLFELGVRF